MVPMQCCVGGGWGGGMFLFFSYFCARVLCGCEGIRVYVVESLGASKYRGQHLMVQKPSFSPVFLTICCSYIPTWPHRKVHANHLLGDSSSFSPF